MATPDPAPRRVLVVDDNVDAAEMLAEALQMAGHTVSLLHDPLDAARQVEESGFDLVILDLGMPGLDGFGVAAAIQARLGARTPRLVALTGYGQARDHAKTKAAGFDAHFVKPVDLDALLDDVARSTRSDAPPA